MKKSRILIFLVNIGTDGISKIISEYIKNLSENVEVEILTYEIINNIYFSDTNVKIYQISSRKKFIKRFFKEKKIMSSNYDVIHINGNSFSRIIECFAAKLSGTKKIIIHSHNDGAENNSNKRKLIQKIMKKFFDYFATDYISCSSGAAKWMFSNKIVSKKKYIVLKNGVTTDLFKFNSIYRNEIRKKFNLENCFVIGCIGRFCYQKNHDFLIDVFNECVKKNKKVRLFLIGSGELKNQIVNKINFLQLEDNVIILENISDVYRYYNAFDCFVLPSRYEGLGIVNIEAQCNGLPTIVSDNVPSEAKVSDLITYIPLSSSPKVWADKILNYLNKKNNRENSYLSVIEYGYDIKSASNNLEQIYLQKK